MYWILKNIRTMTEHKKSDGPVRHSCPCPRPHSRGAPVDSCGVAFPTHVLHPADGLLRLQPWEPSGLGTKSRDRGMPSLCHRLAV